MNLVHFFGIDGSGKTTLTTRAVERLHEAGVPAQYQYAQHTPRLLAPLKWLARRTVIRGTEAAADYSRYSMRKGEARRRFPLAAAIYGVVWAVDYLIATQIVLLRHRFAGGVVLVDRYYPDIAVNIAEAGGWSADTQDRIVRWLGWLLPRPRRAVWVDVPEEIAFARKDDIPSVQYLAERRARYRVLAAACGAHRVDGTRALDSLVDECATLVREVIA